MIHHMTEHVMHHVTDHLTFGLRKEKGNLSTCPNTKNKPAINHHRTGDVVPYEQAEKP
jgi:hypothetical protein